MVPHALLVIALQDPASCLSKLLTFPGVISFAPPPLGRPPVAIHIFCSLNLHCAVSTVFHDSADMISLDVHSPEGLVGSLQRTLRITSVYLHHIDHPPYRSISPERVFSPPPHLYLIRGNFNRHQLLAVSPRSLTDKEYSLSAADIHRAFDTHPTSSILLGSTPFSPST